MVASAVVSEKEPETEARAGREAVPQSALDVGDPRPLVLEGQAYAAARAVVHRLDAHRSAAGVIDEVARELARRRDDLGLVDEREALRDGRFARGLPHAHDVFGALDLDLETPR